MPKTGIAELPLHYGKMPAWLFDKMKNLAREIIIVMVAEFGSDEVLRKFSDPYWFQSFACVLAFDWHSSGATTTVCGALKEGIKGLEDELGLYIAGGKGSTSRKTPSQIIEVADRLAFDPKDLIYASKMAAKVDSAAVQDGYQLYHHSFLFTKGGLWSVVQQGMNPLIRYARRYHWLGESVEDFVCEPHSAVCCDRRGKVLNMVAMESQRSRETSTLLSRGKPERLIGQIEKLKLPSSHAVRLQDIDPKRLNKIFLRTYQAQPNDFEQLLGLQGVGAKTIRALSLISELIYGAKPSFREPARFSFAHGGKDGHPYFVNRRQYQQSIEILRKVVTQAKIDRTDKLKAFRRLASKGVRS